MRLLAFPGLIAVWQIYVSNGRRTTHENQLAVMCSSARFVPLGSSSVFPPVSFDKSRLKSLRPPLAWRRLSNITIARQVCNTISVSRLGDFLFSLFCSLGWAHFLPKAGTDPYGPATKFLTILAAQKTTWASSSLSPFPPSARLSWLSSVLRPQVRQMHDVNYEPHHFARRTHQDLDSLDRLSSGAASGGNPLAYRRV